MTRRRLALLGATGSIGQSAARVVREHPTRLEIVALAANGRDPEGLVALAREFRPRLVAVADERAGRTVSARLAGSGIAIEVGPQAARLAATLSEVDRVIAAMVGAAGLAPVHAALAAGKDVALANKEALVVAGALLTALATRTGARIVPIDSEHVALDQALRAGRRDEVRRLLLTASGGPFRLRDRATWAAIRPEEALRHPTWSMGAKISVDSATMMNKGLEVIEATHLFGLPVEQVDVVVHPQSIVHSMVEYRDGSWIAQLSTNDMVLPVQYALAHPDRWANSFPRLAIEALGALEFAPLDGDRFPTVALARRAAAAGASAPAVLNAANEEAVAAFLAEELSFPGIFAILADVLDAHDPRAVESLDEAFEWDRWGRERARRALSTRARTR